MDFKQQIFDALKAKNFGVSDDILQKVAKSLAKKVTSAEQVATVVEGVTIQQVIESYSDSRATEAGETAVKNYETKHGLKDGKHVNAGGNGTTANQQQPGASGQQPATQQAGGAETIPAWAQALLDSNKALMERVNKMDGERTTATRKQQLSEIIGKLPADLQKAYERTPVDSISDEEFETLKSEISKEVSDIVKNTNAKGAVFGRPSVQHGGNQGSELTDDQKNAISKREGVAKDTQPF